MCNINHMTVIEQQQQQQNVTNAWKWIILNDIEHVNNITM